jgi:chromosome segregation ATPase
MEYKKLQVEARDLRQQIKVYSTLKDNYIEKEANEEESQVYNELMDKLTLLQDKATDEKKQLQKQAKENEKKAEALNQYQQIIRNIINANYIAKARIKKRDTIIVEKDKNISERVSEISQLKDDVKKKEAQVRSGEIQIAKASAELEDKLQKIKAMYRQQKITRKNMDQQIASLTETSQKQIQELQEKTAAINQNLRQVKNELQSAHSELTMTNETLQKEMAAKSRLVEKIENVNKQYEDQLAALKSQHQARMDRERRAFENQLAQEKLTSKQKIARQKEFQKEVERKAQELESKVGNLNSKISETNKQLEQARNIANARKNLAKKIQSNFSKAGIAANVNPETGDVILSFGKEYFDTGSATLKPAMITSLERFMPIYAKSLFQDKKIAEKLKNVEIVGFASPTYQNKYIDPNSLDTKDRAAVNYNLDLSFRRAKSIFNHIFDRDKMNYTNQERLLPLVKVTGRSFLAETTKGRNVASGIGVKEFCDRYNCKDSQKVIIRFDLSD